MWEKTRMSNIKFGGGCAETDVFEVLEPLNGFASTRCTDKFPLFPTSHQLYGCSTPKLSGPATQCGQYLFPIFIFLARLFGCVLPPCINFPTPELRSHVP